MLTSTIFSGRTMLAPDAAWAQANFENGALGYPIGDTHPVAGGVQNDFQHGSLIVFTDGTSQVVLDGADAGARDDAGANAPAPDASVAVTVDAGAPQPQVDAGTAPSRIDPVEPEAVVGGCSAISGHTGWIGLGLLAVLRRRRP